VINDRHGSESQGMQLSLVTSFLLLLFPRASAEHGRTQKYQVVSAPFQTIIFIWPYLLARQRTDEGNNFESETQHDLCPPATPNHPIK
jgi:hypothetical protein